MELQFTFILVLSLICLLTTFLILLKGTKNFIYRTVGLICFTFLLFSIPYGYMNLIGKPKPLTYEVWSSKQGPTGEKKEGMRMDVIEWEHNSKKNEVYLWMRKEREERPNYYSFGTNTEYGKELLKQLQAADLAARRRGLRRRDGTGIKLRIYDKTFSMGKFQFYIPPAPAVLPPKPSRPAGVRYPTIPGADQSDH